jgi:hypothetical protein
MSYDRDKAAEMAPALMYLTSWKEKAEAFEHVVWRAYLPPFAAREVSAK